MLTGRADSSGGPEHVFQLSRQLLERCDVFIAAPKDQPYWDRYTALVGPDRMVELPHRRFSAGALARVNRAVREHAIDVLHSHGRSGGIFGRLSSVATGRCSVHTPHLPHTFGSVKSVVYWAMDWTLSWRSSHLIAVSGSEEITIRRQFLRRRGLSTIPNGVAIADERVNVANLYQPPYRIVHVSRFVPQKNTALVLDVLESLRARGALAAFHVDVLGDGPGRADIAAAARARGLDAHLTFHGTRASIAPYVAKAFCFLSTSLWEGMPLAVLEAMSAGLPAVVSDVPGNADVVSPDVGRRFALQDPAGAATALLELSADPALWSGLSSSARDKVQRFYSVERMAAQTLAVYDRVLFGDRQADAVPEPLMNPRSPA